MSVKNWRKQGNGGEQFFGKSANTFRRRVNNTKTIVKSKNNKTTVIFEHEFRYNDKDTNRQIAVELRRVIEKNNTDNFPSYVTHGIGRHRLPPSIFNNPTKVCCIVGSPRGSITHILKDGRWVSTSNVDPREGDVAARPMLLEDVSHALNCVSKALLITDQERMAHTSVMVITTMLNWLTFIGSYLLGMVADLGLLSETKDTISSATLNTTILPAFWAFSIWGVLDVLYLLWLLYSSTTIIAGCTGFSKRRIVTSSAILTNLIGHKAWVANIFRCLWTVFYVQNTVVYSWFATASLVGYLVPLAMISYSSAIWRIPVPNWADTFFYGVTFSMNLGWASVALTEGIAGSLVISGYKGAPIGEDIWAAAIIAIVYLLAGFMLWTFRDPVYPLPIAWAFIAIYARQEGYVAILSLVLGILLAVSAVVAIILQAITTTYLCRKCCGMINQAEVDKSSDEYLQRIEKFANKEASGTSAYEAFQTLQALQMTKDPITKES